MKHELKIHPEYFEEVIIKNKLFELRNNDRNFEEGDTLLLKEYDPEFEDYTGDTVKVEVTYILKNCKGLKPGYVILGIKHI